MFNEACYCVRERKFDKRKHFHRNSFTNISTSAVDTKVCRINELNVKLCVMRLLFCRWHVLTLWRSIFGVNSCLVWDVLFFEIDAFSNFLHWQHLKKKKNEYIYVIILSFSVIEWILLRNESFSLRWFENIFYAR